MDIEGIDRKGWKCRSEHMRACVYGTCLSMERRSYWRRRFMIFPQHWAEKVHCHNRLLHGIWVGRSVQNRYKFDYFLQSQQQQQPHLVFSQVPKGIADGSFHWALMMSQESPFASINHLVQNRRRGKQTTTWHRFMAWNGGCSHWSFLIQLDKEWEIELSTRTAQARGKSHDTWHDRGGGFCRSEARWQETTKQLQLALWIFKGEGKTLLANWVEVSTLDSWGFAWQFLPVYVMKVGNEAKCVRFLWLYKSYF